MYIGRYSFKSYVNSVVDIYIYIKYYIYNQYRYNNFLQSLCDDSKNIFFYNVWPNIIQQVLTNSLVVGSSQIDKYDDPVVLKALFIKDGVHLTHKAYFSYVLALRQVIQDLARKREELELLKTE